MKAKLFADRRDLRLAVEQLMPAVSTQAPLAVLLSIEVQVDPTQNLIYLSSTDLEVRISTHIPAQIEMDADTPESFLLPAQIFADLLAIMESERVRLDIDGQNLLIQSGATKNKISLLSEDEFPPEFEMEAGLSTFSLSASAFKRALQRVSISASTDDTRLALNSIQIRLSANGELRLTSADGFRLATDQIQCQSASQKECEFLLPLNVAKKLLHILPDDEDCELRIEADSQRALFSWGNMRYWGLLLEANFPEWEELVYEEGGERIKGKPHEFEREDWQMAVKRADIFARDADPAHAVRFTPTDTGILISGKSVEIGQSEEEVASSIQIPFALNALFALQGLTALESYRPSLYLSGSQKPIVFGEDDFIYVVMPLAMLGEIDTVEVEPVHAEIETVAV